MCFGLLRFGSSGVCCFLCNTSGKHLLSLSSHLCVPQPPAPSTHKPMTPHPTTARSRAKYQLRHLVRVNMAGKDAGYGCVYQTEDDSGDVGVRLSKDLTSVAAEALMLNLTRLGPLILPLSEKLLFVHSLIKEKIYGRDRKNPHIPNFKAAVQHICIHSGGRAVIDGMQKALKLSDAETEPSRATLYRWGNVSSASVWYVLAFIESYQGLRAGDKAWQLSFGSGFKCNSAVWSANRTFKFMHPCWSGFDIAKMRAELAGLSEQLAGERAARHAAAAAGQPVKDCAH